MRIYIIAIIACCTLWGCSEDYFTRELDVDVPELDTLLNIFALVDAGTDGATARVSHTRDVQDDGAFEVIDDATITLFVDDTEVTPLFHEGEGFYRSIRPVNFNTEEAFTMRVEHPRFPDSEATVFRPDAVPLDQVTIDTSRLSPDSDFVTTVEFSDPLGQNFYALRATVVTDDEEPIFIFSDFEAIFTESSFGLLFDDKTFNGQDVSLLVNTRRRFVGPGNGFIVYSLLSMNQALHDYLITAEFAFENEDNPFAEPVIIPSNFENAVGAFGIFSTDEIVARVE